ncbi:MAG: hypothetical protein ACPLZ9_04960 [Candidatus Ratteibacteria bacterium]
MISKRCPYFGKCNAPICPMDPDKERAVWYPDEEICKNREFNNLNFIITQKKIAKINKRHEVQGIFTFAMLNRPLKIYKSISGLNEDQDLDDIAKSENAWIQKHRGMSEKTKLKLLSNLGKEKTEVRENEI